MIETNFTDVRINPAVDAAASRCRPALRADAAKPAVRNVPYQWVIRRQFIGIYLDSDNASYDTRGSQGCGCRRSRRACSRSRAAPTTAWWSR